MALPLFPLDSLPGLGIQISRSSILPISVQTDCQGGEQRIGRRSAPLYDFELRFNFLRQANLQAVVDELAVLNSFFEGREGALGAFAILDPVDGEYRAVRFEDDNLTAERFLHQVFSSSVRLKGITPLYAGIGGWSVSFSQPLAGTWVDINSEVAYVSVVSDPVVAERYYTYRWVYDDGPTPPSEDGGASSSHTWTTSGSHLATVYVKDELSGIEIGEGVSVNVAANIWESVGEVPGTPRLDQRIFSGQIDSDSFLIGNDNSSHSKEYYTYDGATWSKVGDMLASIDRSNAFRLARLPNGDLMLAGGVNYDTSSRRGVYLYSVAAKTWSQAADLPSDAAELQLAELPNGEIFAINYDGYLPNYSIYNQGTGVWTTRSFSGGLLGGFQAVVSQILRLPDGRLFIHHRHNLYSTSTRRVSLYTHNSVSGGTFDTREIPATWTQFCVPCLTHDGLSVLFIGYPGFYGGKKLARYNIASDTIDYLADAPWDSNSQIYRIGATTKYLALSNDSNFKGGMIYDSATDAWTTDAYEGYATIYNSTVGLIAGQLHVFGGAVGGSDDVNRFDGYTTLDYN